MLCLQCKKYAKVYLHHYVYSTDNWSVTVSLETRLVPQTFFDLDLVLVVGICHRVVTMKDNQFENICSECILSECDITI